MDRNSLTRRALEMAEREYSACVLERDETSIRRAAERAARIQRRLERAC